MPPQYPLVFVLVLAAVSILFISYKKGGFSWLRDLAKVKKVAKWYFFVLGICLHLYWFYAIATNI